ncbi:MAG TPA: HIT family protein [Phycisphaerae bacterium]|nr:HIT family protein [Phycisphaerae bacterium]
MPDSVHAGPCCGSPGGEDAACAFCREAVRSRPVAEQGTVLAVPDASPVAAGHLLVITRRHTADLFSMTAEEKRDALDLLAALRERALREDPAITGFNVGINCGASAGQGIMHAHFHFIPRRDGEEGGPGRVNIKGVIRNKMTY